MTPDQEAMVALWEAHTAAEFATADVSATMETMTTDPHVNHVPVMTGGVGGSEVRAFYERWFIPAQAPDTEVVTVTRTVGEERIVDEILFRFTHTVPMPWILPGIEPTGRRVEIPLVVVVGFEGGRIASEHIYWDQASVLIQVGLLDAGTLPIAGAEATRKAVDVRSAPSNGLIVRGQRAG